MADHRLTKRAEAESTSSHAAVQLLVADPDPLTRHAVRTGMAQRSDIEIVAETSSGSDAVGVLTERRPDVVLLCAESDHDGAAAVTRRMLATAPESRIIVFAATEDDAVALSALDAGALGFLPKDIDMSALARAIRSVAAGEAAISRRLALRLVRRLQAMSRQARHMRPVASSLTQRQWEVLDMLIEGRSLAEIAELLQVSRKTARNHVRMALRELGAQSVEDATRLVQGLRCTTGAA